MWDPCQSCNSPLILNSWHIMGIEALVFPFQRDTERPPRTPLLVWLGTPRQPGERGGPPTDDACLGPGTPRLGPWGPAVKRPDTHPGQLMNTEMFLGDGMKR